MAINTSLSFLQYPLEGSAIKLTKPFERFLRDVAIFTSASSDTIAAVVNDILESGESTPIFDTLTVTGLNGVVKASSGVFAGSATTSDLPEGSNLYYTQARFNTAYLAKHAITTITSATYTVTASDYCIIADTSSNAITVTLPTAVGIAGVEYVFKCVSAVNNLTIDGNAAETIDGSATKTLTNLQFAKLISNGSNWWIISN